ncbi:carbohydrate sulfotransferase 9-like [Mercenaria mercenaria]|uniref:carbohydrate sulfotransferase 9-like n=1 Tax=Mercenaria mercenaria TaxID=6596 RepID=UPI00234F0189|nr:carbohydrate sulfotransferase 9-like [Mercenaria mercenaria]
MRRLRRANKPYVLLAIAVFCFAITAYFSFSEEKHIRNIDMNSFVSWEKTETVMDQLADQIYKDIPVSQSKYVGTYKQMQTTEGKKIMQEPATVLPIDETERRFNERKGLLQEACVKYKRYNPICERKTAGFNYKYVNESNLVYCAIEKTGSTLWKRILHVIGGWSNSSNPTSIKSEAADTYHGGFETLENSTMDEMQEIFNNSDSIMFVRDPFTRLFSAWLDKLYSPNHYYWTNIGPLIVKSERLSKEEWNSSHVTCASDISFTEFINFTIKEVTFKMCADGHFSPSHKHCLPCLIPFDYIGKYETFKEDTTYLLNKLNLSHKVTFDDFETDAARDAIRDSTEWVFSQKEKLLECNVTFHCALFKVWNRMQSRGFISTKIKFPFESVDEVKNVTKDDIISVLTKAYRESDPNETKGNRMEALRQAFQHLPSKLRTRLVLAFKVDFAMFGYDRNPEYLNKPLQTSFNYFKECQE